MSGYYFLDIQYMPVLIMLTALFAVFRYCIKAKAKPSVQDNIDMTDFYDDDYDLDDDYDDYDEEEDDEAADDTDDSGTGKVDISFFICLIRDEDPDPVGSVDFWPAGSGSGTFFKGSGSCL